MMKLLKNQKLLSKVLKRRKKVSPFFLLLLFRNKLKFWNIIHSIILEKNKGDEVKEVDEEEPVQNDASIDNDRPNVKVMESQRKNNLLWASFKLKVSKIDLHEMQKYWSCWIIVISLKIFNISESFLLKFQDGLIRLILLFHLIKIFKTSIYSSRKPCRTSRNSFRYFFFKYFVWFICLQQRLFTF